MRASVCLCASNSMCACICTLVGGGQYWDNNQWPSFLPSLKTSSVRSNDCYLLAPSLLTFPIYSSYSPPLTGLTHSPTPSFYLAVFFPTLLPLPSLFLVCCTVERWKSFLYPTHHSPVTINSIYVCLNQRHMALSTCTYLHEHTHEHARISHPHTQIWSHPSSP